MSAVHSDQLIINADVSHGVTSLRGVISVSRWGLSVGKSVDPSSPRPP